MSQNTTAMQRGAGGETTGATDMTTQQPEALQCAADLEYSIARHGMQDAFTLNAYRAMKMVRTQQARITDLEAQLEAIGAGGVSGPLIGQPQAMPDLSQLTERGAKAWAGVDAQGLREGFTAADMATAAAQGFRDGVAAPQPAVAAGWQSIETAPKDGSYLLLWEQYSETPFVGYWSGGSWSVSHEHVDAEGGWDGANAVDALSMPITHWMPLPAAPGPADGEIK